MFKINFFIVRKLAYTLVYTCFKTSRMTQPQGDGEKQQKPYATA